MTCQPRHLQLKEQDDLSQRIRILTDALSLSAEDSPQSWVTLTRTGSFYHPQYGRFEHTRQLLEDLIKNFNGNVYGQDIAIDVAHKPEDGAAGYVRKLSLDGGKLRALVEWTPFGVDAVKNKGYRYLSVDYTDNYIDNEQRNEHGPLLFGAGLVVRPHVKHLDRVVLAEDADSEIPTIIPERIAKKLQEENTMKWAHFITAMMAAFSDKKLAETIQVQFKQLAEAMLAGVEEEAKAKLIIDTLQTGAIKLGEEHQGGEFTIKLDEAFLKAAGSVGADNPDNKDKPKTLSEADVKRILKDAADAEAEKARKLSESNANKQKVLTEAIDGADGLEDDVKTTLKKELAELITPAMSDDQIKALAEREIKHANDQAAARKLSEMGFPVNTPAGRVQVNNPHATEAARLQAIQHEQLRSTSAFLNGDIRLSEDKDLPNFTKEVLKVFDSQFGVQIGNAVRTLSEGGPTNMNHVDLPVGFQREVIREALSDLNVLNLVSTFVDPAATVATQIPYEQRKTGGLTHDGIVFERGAIPKAGVSQKMHTAYINAMKLAIDVSNEVMHFSKSSGINWDAWARNLASAARLMREILCRRIANEMQRAADAFGANDISEETITLDGGVYKTAQFPVVREKRVYDLQGNPVGSPQNPLVVKDGSTELAAFNGSGKQAAGTYYAVVNYNLGYVVLVDQTGAAAAATGTVKISYSYATNVKKVDSDVPNGMSPEVHLNKLIQAIGSRKAIMSGERFIQPNFLLMSPSLNDTCTNAEQFTYQAKRNGSDTSSEGDLITVKGVSAFGTNAPGIDLGDERILMGQRGTTSYTVAKPWMMSEPIEARDEHGQLTGAKESYGEEYNAIDTPPALYDRYTSVLFYSFSNR
ncbi:phage protease [Endozoicomonas sp. ALC066]|uniref:phage protease n=1 Tax=Endozoicomonas sp. ALC066 TaxID=3403078 RepID=UPI003BB67230